MNKTHVKTFNSIDLGKMFGESTLAAGLYAANVDTIRSVWLMFGLLTVVSTMFLVVSFAPGMHASIPALVIIMYGIGVWLMVRHKNEYNHKLSVLVRNHLRKGFNTILREQNSSIFEIDERLDDLLQEKDTTSVELRKHYQNLKALDAPIRHRIDTYKVTGLSATWEDAAWEAQNMFLLEDDISNWLEQRNGIVESIAYLQQPATQAA